MTGAETKSSIICHQLQGSLDDRHECPPEIQRTKSQKPNSNAKTSPTSFWILEFGSWQNVVLGSALLNEFKPDRRLPDPIKDSSRKLCTCGYFGLARST